MNIIDESVPTSSFIYEFCWFPLEPGFVSYWLGALSFLLP